MELLSELLKRYKPAGCVVVKEFKFPYWEKILINKVSPNMVS